MSTEEHLIPAYAGPCLIRVVAFAPKVVQLCIESGVAALATITADEARELAAMLERAAGDAPDVAPCHGAVLRDGIDYVAVVSLNGERAEQECTTFEEAHGIATEAKRRGAEEAYVDERPIRRSNDNCVQDAQARLREALHRSGGKETAAVAKARADLRAWEAGLDDDGLDDDDRAELAAIDELSTPAEEWATRAAAESYWETRKHTGDD